MNLNSPVLLITAGVVLTLVMALLVFRAMDRVWAKREAVEAEERALAEAALAPGETLPELEALPNAFEAMGKLLASVQGLDPNDPASRARLESLAGLGSAEGENALSAALELANDLPAEDQAEDEFFLDEEE